MRNQKGFTGLEIVAIAAISFLAITIITPILKPFLGGGAGDKSVQKQTHVVKTVPAADEKGNAIYVTDSTGKRVQPLLQSEETTTSSDEQTTPPAPWYDRVIGWFIRLGALGAIIAFLFPATFIAIVAWIRARWAKLADEIKAHKADLTNLKTEAQRIVLSVDDGLSAFDGQIKASLAMVEATADPTAKAVFQATATALTNAKAAFLTAMSKKQDGSTKLIVTQLQQTSPITSV